MTLNKGAMAIGSLTAQPAVEKTTDFTKLESGESIKVRVKSAEDLAQYFNYGIFGSVKSFVPDKPSTRDAKGYVVSDYTAWDLAEKYYRELQFAEIRNKNKAAADKHGEEARKYKATEKYLMGFFELSKGEDIVVDMTKKQALNVYQTILEYAELDGNGNPIAGAEHDFLNMAFKLSKTGASTSTSFSLTPIINLQKGLSEEENVNFEKSAGETFDQSLFDGLLFEADEAMQVSNLIQAGFDISLIGLEKPTIAQAVGETPLDGEPTEVGDDDLPF